MNLFDPPTKEELEEADKEASGLFAPPTKEELAEFPDEKGPGALSLLRSGVSGHTAGISEAVINAIKAGIKNPPILDPMIIPDEPMSTDKLVADYKAAQNERQAEIERNPGAHLAANIGGALIPSPVNVGSKIMGAASGAVKGAIPALEKYALGRVAQGTATGAIGGAGQAATNLIGTGQGDIESGAAFGGALGGAIPGIGEGLKAGGNLIGMGIKKGAPYMTPGSSADKVREYLARKMNKSLPSLDETPSQNEIADQAEAATLKAREILAMGETKAEKAATEAKTAGDAYKKVLDSTIEKNKEAVSTAEKELADAFKAQKQELGNVELPEGYTKRVINAISNVKKKLGEASSRSFDALAADGATVDKRAIQDVVKKAQSELVDAELGILDQGAYDELGSYLAKSEGWKDTLSLGSVKKIIQDVDKLADYSHNVAKMQSPASAQFKDIRRNLDAYLKTSVPNYEKAMAETSALRRLLDEAEMFGTEVKAASIPGMLSGERGKVLTPIVSEIAKQGGDDILTPAQRVNEAKRLAKNLDKESLPEAKKVAELQNVTTLDSDYFNAVKNAKSAREAAKLKADRLEQMQKDVGSIAKMQPKTARNLTRLSGRDQEFQLRQLKEMEPLDEIGGLAQKVKDRALLDYFEKPTINGSRRVVLGSILGEKLGAMAGYVTDIYGRKVTKAMLDAIAAMDNVSPSTIQQSKAIPKEVKDALMRAYMQSVILNNSTSKEE